MRNTDEIIFGRHPVEEALQGGRPLKKIFLAQGLKDPTLEVISRLAEERGVPVQRRDRQALDRLAPGMNHQGIAAIAAPFAYAALDDLFGAASGSGEDPFFLVLDHLQDPHNFGALLRTAEAVGVHGVIIPEHRAVGVTTGVYKASVGAVENIPVAKVTNLARTLTELKERGVWVMGADMEGEQIFCKADLKGPLALVLGGEGRGISRLIREKCDFRVRLPMQGKTGSLNVSVAGGILMYEVYRQRHPW
jgi:23S rRNA (guanosine2251-2'-O)-methyltransferase